MRAALKVARAAAAEEQRRRQALEDQFDAGLAEAIGKARAVSVYTAAASGASSATDTPRLLGRDAPSPSSSRGRGDGEEGEGEGGQMKGEAGADKAEARVSDGVDGWGGKSITTTFGGGGGGGGGGDSSPRRDGDGGSEQAQLIAAGEERGRAQEEEEEAGEKGRQLEALVTAAEAAVERTRAAATVKEKENQERGCAKGGLDWVVELLCVPVPARTARTTDRSLTSMCLP